MLRGEGIVCGTSTTGTGALTTATCPAPPGGVDFYAWLTATAIGFVNGNVIPLTYNIIEYTDSTFATAKQMEVGTGTLTLGSSITGCTLTRTTVEVTATGMNSVPTYNVNSPSPISIGTAANTLVFVGASAAHVAAFSPYRESALGDGIGTFLSVTGVSVNAPISLNLDASGDDHYFPVNFFKQRLLTIATVRVSIAYTGGTPLSSAYFRLYGVNSSGRPGKLIRDFGALGGANPLNATGYITSAVLSPPLLVAPGEYFGNLYVTFTGGTGGPGVLGGPLSFASGILDAKYTNSNIYPLTHTIATSGNSTAPDPANVTGYAVTAASSTIPNIPAVLLG